MDNIKLDNFNEFMWDCHRARQCKIHNDYLYMFYIEFSKKIDNSNDWLTVFIKYEMSKFAIYAGISSKPLPDFRELSRNFIEVPQAFADQIKTNQSFIKTLKIRLAEYAKSRGKPDASFDKVFSQLERNGVSTIRNNKIAQAQVSNKKIAAAREATKAEIKAAAAKYGANQEWSYYSEYYRGPNAIAHDDDYEGSGSCSFESVALKLCKNEADVKKLASIKIGLSIEYVEDRYRTFYRRTK